MLWFAASLDTMHCFRHQTQLSYRGFTGGQHWCQRSETSKVSNADNCLIIGQIRAQSYKDGIPVCVVELLCDEVLSWLYLLMRVVDEGHDDERSKTGFWQAREEAIARGEDPDAAEALILSGGQAPVAIAKEPEPPQPQPQTTGLEGAGLGIDADVCKVLDESIQTWWIFEVKVPTAPF